MDEMKKEEMEDEKEEEAPPPESGPTPTISPPTLVLSGLVECKGMWYPSTRITLPCPIPWPLVVTG
jgi:hypothetical protein